MSTSRRLASTLSWVSVWLCACSSPDSPPPTAAAAPSARALDVRWVGDADDRALPFVLLLHGYGAPADDLVPLAEELRASMGDELRVALPAAPLPHPSGRAWWEIAAGPRPSDRGTEQPRGLPAARRDVLALLNGWVGADRIDPSRTVLVGFSQGGMLATDLALEWSERVAGVASLSGGPLDEERWVRRARARPLPIFLSHGRVDPLLVFGAAERLSERLEDAGLDVTWVPFEGRHEIPPVARTALVAFVRGALQ